MNDRTTYLNSSQVCARYGNLSAMTIWRWMRDPRTNFPKPIYANSRHRLWSLASLEAWEESRTIEGEANASAA